MPVLRDLLFFEVLDAPSSVPEAPDAARLPLKPQSSTKVEDMPEDERMALNLIFLKYVQVSDMVKLLDPFRGEGSSVSTYDPANLIILLDNNRNMRRNMEMINLFDSDSFASKRVKLFDIKNGRPSDIAKELGKDGLIVMNMCGRGDKDIFTVATRDGITL